MNLIGDLRIATPEHGAFRYARFQKLADELAIETRPVWVKNPTKPDTDDLLRQLNALLEHCDAFYIHDYRYFQIPGIREKISQRIKAGIRVLVDTNSSTAEHESELNSFLSNYSANATKISIFRKDRPTEVSSFELICDVHPECFRDSELFAGVAELSVTQPRLIWYTGNTRPVAVLPREEVMLVDEATGLLHHWHTRELAYVVKHTDPETSTRVLAFSGSILVDRELERSGNRKFATNLLRWATGTLGTKPTAKEYLDEIEISLYDAIRSVLSRKSKAWDRDCVPDKVKEKCQLKMTDKRGANRKPTSTSSI